MFKRENKSVTRCPVTVNSVGVIRMKPEHVGVLAGAVQDAIEWMVLLHGKRSDDGYEVDVEKISVPKQSRNGTEAHLVEDIDLAEDVVGVVHSHHTMGAFFSGTDDTELNPRFPTSIVVARGRNNYGFNYKAEGKVKLPCGSVGIIEFELAVTGDEEHDLEPLRATHEGEVDSLMSCPHVATTAVSKYAEARQAKCGLKEDKIVELHAIYGTEATETLKEIQAQTVQPPKPKYTTQVGAHVGYGWYNQDYSYYNNAGKQKHKAKGGGFTPARYPSRPAAFQSGCDVCGAHPPKIYFYREVNSWLCDECGETFEKLNADEWHAYVQHVGQLKGEKVEREM